MLQNPLRNHRTHPPIPSEAFLEHIREIGNEAALALLTVATDLVEHARKEPSQVRDSDVIEVLEARKDVEHAAVILRSLARRWGIER